MKKLIILTLLATLLVALLATNVQSFDWPGGVCNMSIGIYAQSGNLSYFNLRNSTKVPTSTIVPSVNISGNQSTGYVCKLFGTMNGSNGLGTYHEIETMSAIPNATATNFSKLTVSDAINYDWAVFCNYTSAPAGTGCQFGALNSTNARNIGANAGSNWYFSVDTVAPSFANVYPTTDLIGDSVLEWVNSKSGNVTGAGNATVYFGANVTDNNADVCWATINYNLSTNSTDNNHTFTTPVSYTNATLFKFTESNDTVGWGNNNSGYGWRIMCNDTAGNNASVGGTFKVDTVVPAAFEFNTTAFMTDANIYLPNGSYSTDYRPQIGWANTSGRRDHSFPTEYDGNFARYRIRFYEGVENYSTFIEYNFTTQNTSTWGVNYNLTSDLDADKNYTFLITAFDSAGNQRNTTTIRQTYTTVSLGHTTYAGWNIFGNPGVPVTLSQIKNRSGATTVAIWNTTHQWESHSTDGDAYGATSVAGGKPYLIYMAAAGTYNDSVRNTTIYDGSTGNTNTMSFNLTNSTFSDWNLVVNTNWSNDALITQGFTMQYLDLQWNLNHSTIPIHADNFGYINLSFMSFYDNSASSSPYTSYVSNFSESPENDTMISFMEPIWIYVDDDVLDQNKTSGPVPGQQHTAYQEETWKGTGSDI